MGGTAHDGDQRGVVLKDVSLQSETQQTDGEVGPLVPDDKQVLTLTPTLACSGLRQLHAGR